MTEQIFRGINMSPITSHNIMSVVNDEKIKIMDIITKKLKGKVISLKMDSATRHGRSVLGINAQIIENGKVEVYTLIMKEINARQTGLNLKGEVEEVLCISVAAHTLQLVVKDFLNRTDVTAIIENAQVVKTLRMPKWKQSLQILKLGKPPLDVPTRWSSTFTLLDKLTKYREFCNEHLNGSLSNSEWEQILDLLLILRPIYETTLNFQQEQLIMGDAYRAWFELKVKLESLNSEASSTALNCIVAREPNLLNTTVLNAAVFLDPRFRRMLPSAKKEEARVHLKKLAAQFVAVKQIDRRDYQPTQRNPESDETATETPNVATSSLVRRTIRNLEVDSSSEDEASNSEVVLKIFGEIDMYRERRVDIDVKLQEDWEEKKYTFPFLKQLAEIVHPTPATQVSVERAFSALRLVLSDLRCNLSEDTLFVKLNKKDNV